MPGSILALKMFILLLPGFLSIKVSERLTLHKEKSAFQYTVDAFVFSLIIALFYLLAVESFPDKLVSLDEIDLRKGDISFGGFNTTSFVTLIGIAFIVGSVHGFIVEKGWVSNLLTGSQESEKWQVTRRTGRLNVWTDVFYNYNNSWLRVYMEDGAIIQGWCSDFSNSADKLELFLQDIQIYKKEPDGELTSDSETFKNYNRKILLTNPKSIKMIEFLEKKENEDVK